MTENAHCSKAKVLRKEKIILHL